VEDQNEQLNNLHHEMEAASRKLNAAQMATGALHNVKNVLNSLIVGTSMMGRILSDSKIGRVAKVAQLLRDNQSQLGTFLSEGERGRFLPDFLTTLSQSLEREHDMIYKELQGLTKNLEHIKFSIQLQLSSTRLSESGEFLNLEDVVEDALKVNANTLNRNQVRIRRMGEGLPMLPGNRHKVLQILVNLISNAIHALEGVKDSEPTITISMETPDPSKVSITVTDNGSGISREHLDNIFSYGFTTRRGGHGLGLHSCLQLAAEMGGNLTAHSDGRGKGSSFTLSLPVPPGQEE
jgi:signal transduction histidine kinase